MRVGDCVVGGDHVVEHADALVGEVGVVPGQAVGVLEPGEEALAFEVRSQRVPDQVLRQLVQVVQLDVVDHGRVLDDPVQLREHLELVLPVVHCDLRQSLSSEVQRFLKQLYQRQTL